MRLLSTNSNEDSKQRAHSGHVRESQNTEMFQTLPILRHALSTCGVGEIETQCKDVTTLKNDNTANTHAPYAPREDGVNLSCMVGCACNLSLSTRRFLLKLSKTVGR